MPYIKRDSIDFEHNGPLQIFLTGKIQHHSDVMRPDVVKGKLKPSSPSDFLDNAHWQRLTWSKLSGLYRNIGSKILAGDGQGLSQHCSHKVPGFAL